MEIKQIPCNPKNYSSTKRAVSDIKYIVIHYVGAEGGSEANGNYYKNNNVGASAHLYVGHKGEPYVQSVPDNCVAWSVGTAGYYTQKHPICRNSNSISIELCCWHKNNVWTVDDETVEKALALTEMLMKKYNIPKSNVLRHWDCVNKRCPEFWVDDKRWKNEFWNKLNTPKTPVKNVANATDTTFDNVAWVKKIQAAIGAKVDGKPGSETLSKTPTIKRGTVNIEVIKLIQEKLKTLGYVNFIPNGKYGNEPYRDMLDAVIKYQKEVVGLKNPDGEFTAKGASWKAILGIK
jgi:N-acetylmuramoyl-L-alanine amidase CwlA